MVGFLCFLVFVILNCINTSIIIVPIYGPDSWQYWVGMLCTCGCYLTGCIRYILKNNK